jgi:opacity protein-like surface antigen
MRPASIASIFAQTMLAALAVTSSAEGEPQRPEGPQPRSTVPQQSHSLGFQALFVAGYEFPESKESFKAVGLNDEVLTLGGGLQLTNLWRSLFVQIHVTRLDETGERVFVSQSGEAVKLGIPLQVTGTFTDVGVGWRFVGSSGRVVPYAGGGLGAVNYHEESPFGVTGEEFRRTELSYNAFGGVEFGLTGWAALGVEARYRHVPGVLGEGGVSEALGEDSLSGTTAMVRVLLGPRGLPKIRGPEVPGSGARPAAPLPPDAGSVPPAPPVSTPPPPPHARPTGERRATVTQRTGIFIRPDAITPLRMVEPGTTLRVLEGDELWLRVQFRDRQWGDRVGYILREHCRVSAP